MTRLAIGTATLGLLLWFGPATAIGDERTPSVPSAGILISLLDNSRFTGSGANMSPRLYRPQRLELAAGAECPNGSGRYCSDELPYCCPGVNVAAYCAKDVNGCTQ